MDPVPVSIDQIGHVGEVPAAIERLGQAQQGRLSVEDHGAVEEREHLRRLGKLLAQHRHVRSANRDMTGQSRLLDQVGQRHPRQHLVEGGDGDAHNVRRLLDEPRKHVVAQKIVKEVPPRVAHGPQQLMALISGHVRHKPRQLE